MLAEIWEYSQWFPGIDNQVADALSRDWVRTDTDLTNIFRTHLPSQVPTSFTIVPLPYEISSYVTLLLLKLAMQMQYREARRMTMLGRGADGAATAS